MKIDPKFIDRNERKIKINGNSKKLPLQRMDHNIEQIKARKSESCDVVVVECSISFANNNNNFFAFIKKFN